jgi:hypothetical protein
MDKKVNRSFSIVNNRFLVSVFKIKKFLKHLKVMYYVT